jgi:glutaredoxin
MFIVYSKDDCSYCRKAKDFLAFLGEEYKEYNISEDPSYKAEMIERLQYDRIDPPYTYPQIWNEDGYIGGCDNLFKIME